MASRRREPAPHVPLLYPRSDRHSLRGVRGASIPTLGVPRPRASPALGSAYLGRGRRGPTASLTGREPDPFFSTGSVTSPGPAGPHGPPQRAGPGPNEHPLPVIPDDPAPLDPPG